MRIFAIKENRDPKVFQLATFNSHKVFIVDGGIVRDDFDTDFADMGQHLHNNCIPPDEYWIEDHVFLTSNRDVPKFLLHLKIEEALMKKGIPYRKAFDEADRRVNKMIHGQSTEEKPSEDLIKIQPIVKGSDLTIWLVRGEEVRKMDEGWVGGGHHYVYSFIPEGEVWIEETNNPSDMFAIMLHEVVERKRMKNLGEPYNNAHKYATEVERVARQYGNAEERLKQELHG